MPRLPNASPGAAPMLTPEYTIRKTIPEVQLQFSVADQKGRLVQDLSASDVRVLDDQSLVPEFRRFERVDDLPLRVGLVLDVSASMRKVLPQEKTAALAFLKQVLRPQTDRAFVLAFGSKVEMEQDATGDTEELTGAVEHISVPNHGTDLFDALYSACNEHWTGHGSRPESGAVHRVIVVVTDGDDTGSLHTIQDVAAASQRNEVQIYPLAIHPRNRIAEGDGVLRRLADESGGKFYVASAAKDLAPIFAEIEQDLRTQYYLSFRPEHDGPGFHSLRVEVRSPEKLQIHARQGYYVR